MIIPIRKLFFILFWIPSIQITALTNADSLRIDYSEKKVERNFSDNFQSKYTEKVFDYNRTKEIKPTLWQRIKMWFAEQFSKIFRLSSTQVSERIITKIFQIGGIILILFVLYKIIMAFVNEEGSWIFGKKSDSIEIYAQDIEQNIFQIDFEQFIKEAIQKKQYRWAIRYYYLLTLKNLAQKNIIDWHPEKTNNDYFLEIKQPDVQKQFSYVSYLYNYCWYGEFDISENEFLAGEKSYKHFINTL
jgi:hypothetical protein